jgi:hypothetical protein
MIAGHPQDRGIRRAYLIRPRPALAPKLESMGLADELDFLARQTVLMTEPLPYETKLEGYREVILEKCKEIFLKDLCELSALADATHRETLFGRGISPLEAFDLWWTAEVVETMEIPTTW